MSVEDASVWAVSRSSFGGIATFAGGRPDRFGCLTPEIRPSSRNNLFVFALRE
uniref:Uncharacterized protein n=1 Tax=uncultured Gemmatimonadales bacterium HF0770_11C06 TaxID=723616 RepID=E7C6W4_9BACT|nr:hypothetical protein [uncultured Gemmatimonadales bacterium HF0770_11C06]